MVKRHTKKKQRTERFHRAVYASSQRLATFLMEESANHAGCYFQYTTIDALEGMYKNGCLLLTQARGLNDLDEMGVESEEKERTYVASFSTLRSESIAMWALYGMPAVRGIRIQFPKTTMRELVRVALGENTQHSVFKAEFYKTKRRQSLKPLKQSLRVEEAYLTDVIYRGKNALTWRGDVCVVKELKMNELLADTVAQGLVKDDFWRYENEVRLIVRLERKLEKYPSRIAIQLPTLLKKARVVLGPCFDKEPERELIEDLKKVKKIKFNESSCTRKVRFSRDCPCKGCTRQCLRA